MGASDHQQLVLTSLKTKSSRLTPISISYRDYKKLEELAFLQDLNGVAFDKINFLLDEPNHAFIEFQDIFKAIVDCHAPLETKEIRGNQALFMNKELAKTIMMKSVLKNNFVRYKTKCNWIAYKKQTKLRNKIIKNYCSKETEKGVMTNKAFWKAIRPFLANKAHMIHMI